MRLNGWARSNPFAVRRRRLRTTVSPAICQERLRALLAHPLAVVPFRERPISGRVSDEGFVIRRFLPYRNPFQTEVVGQFMRRQNWTDIALRLGLAHWVRVATALWFVGWVLFAASAVASSLLALPPSRPDLLQSGVRTIVVAGVMVAFGAMVACLGRFLARGEEDFLVRLLKQTLEAEEVPAEGG